MHSPTPPRRRLVRMLLAGLLAGAAITLTTGPAAAHIGVAPGCAPGGSTATITLKIPNERSGAATTQVAVSVPIAQPTSLEPSASGAWTADVEQAGGGTVVRWSGDRLEGTRSGSFRLTVGPLPAGAEALTLKTTQTYDDGLVVRWIEDRSGQNPAPVLRLRGSDCPPVEPPAHSSEPAGSAPAGGGDTTQAPAVALQAQPASEEPAGSSFPLVPVLIGTGLAIGISLVVLARRGVSRAR